MTEPNEQSTPAAESEYQFKLSATSLANLQGVHEDLVAVVERAIQLTSVDFGVSEGLRSKADQEKAVASGNSRTLDSRHLSGNAVDLTAYINGKVSWDWPHYGEICSAMIAAAKELGFAHVMTWGGCWDRTLEQLSGDPYNDHNAYMKRFAAANPGRKGLADGPHFQLNKPDYP